MPRLPSLAMLLAAAIPLAGADGVQAEVKPASPQPTQPAKPDPTAAVIAEGHFTYRQRDLDALMLVAQRHLKAKLGKLDEERLRQALIQALTAREPLLEALGALPSSFAGKAREALVLDLLDYQAEPATISAEKTPAATRTAAAAPATAAPAQVDGGPVLVRLPVISLTRTLEGFGKRQLTLGLALAFRDAAQAKALETKAPLIQDAIIGVVQRLAPMQFAEPDQLALKDSLTKAVLGKVPEFPVDGILVPQLDATAPDAAPAASEPAR